MNAFGSLRRACCVGAVLVIAVACDDDPVAPEVAALTPQVLVPDTVGRQEALRVVFPRPVDPRTALDPSNFVVTNLCTGLRVPGALRLEENTLIFSPSEAIPFLTPLAVRVQNILDLSGRGMPAPVLFTTITEAPPVSDVSWEELNSPTNDLLLSASFVNRDVGYITSVGGEVFRTTNGGITFGALFKDADINLTRLRVATPDSLYMVGATSFGGSTFTAFGLLRSANAGLTFDTVFTEDPADMRSITVRRVAGSSQVFIAGNRSRLATWRYDQETGAIHRFGPVTGEIGNAGDQSPDGSHAVVVGQTFPGFLGPFNAVAHRSTDGGQTFTPVTLPTLPILRTAGFIDNTTALLGGDSSLVLRLDAATGAVTPLGAANGIPQTRQDGQVVTAYQFFAIRFVSDAPLGWIAGREIESAPGRQDIVRGVILITRDGGQTFTRQAVRGARDNGLGFPTIADITALARDFAVVAGDAGFVAARPADTSGEIAACAFQNQG